MIHLGNSHQSTEHPSIPRKESKSAMQFGLSELDRYQKEVGKWIERNPVLSLGIALAIGLGAGWMFRRNR
jgi:hypothetical protein